MKKLFTLIFFCVFLPQFLKAQPALNSYTVPSIGTSISAKVVQDNTLDAGLAGNQTWDFSGVSFASATTTTSTIVSVASTGHSASFPTATLAESTAQGNYAFYNLTSTQQTMLGIRDNTNSQTVVYTNPMTLVQFPLTYNAAPQTDNFGYSTAGIGYTITDAGTINTTYDGYGTLITENGTYNNVIRLKLIKDETITYDYGDGFIMSTNYNSTSYSWVVPGNYTAIFSLIDLTVTSDFGNSQSVTAYLYNSGVASNKNSFVPNLKITVGPNPTSDEATVDFVDVEAGNYVVSLLDEKGTQISKENLEVASGSTHKINLSDLSNGLYLVKVTSDKGESIKKIIKN